MKQQDMEFVVKEELEKKRGQIKDFDDLIAFLRDVEENYGEGYGVQPRAMAQACLAVAYYLSGKFGITGFQAGGVMWEFILGWNRKNNKTGLKLVDYDNMLYPQYEHEFEKTISLDTWRAIQNAAEEELKNVENHYYVHPSVIAHWMSIVEGKVPFGYKITTR